MKHAILASLILSSSLILYASEGTRDAATGQTLRYRGYGATAAEIAASPWITLDINRKEMNRAEEGDKRWIDAARADLDELQTRLVTSIGLWNNCPTTRVRLRLGVYRSVSKVDADDRNVVTLTTFKADEDWTGIATPYRGEENGRAFYAEFDVAVAKSLLAVADQRFRAPFTLTHEIGHGLGFQHSWMNRDVMDQLTAADSIRSIMGYRAVADGEVAALNAEDVALVSRLYPVLSRPSSRETGTIRGRALSTDGANELFGGMVLVVGTDQGPSVNPLPGQAILSRLSGFETSNVNGPRDGFFHLDGVPPGVYDVLVVAFDDTMLTRSETNQVPVIAASVDFAGNTFVDLTSIAASSFVRSWVRGVPVAAGEIVDLGFIQAGRLRNVGAAAQAFPRDRSFDPNVADNLDNRALVQGTVRILSRVGVTRYWYDFWGRTPWGMAHRSGPMTTLEYTRRLPAGMYAVQVYEWRNSRWSVLRPWSWVDWRARQVSIGWTRSQATIPILGFPVTLEPWRYFISVAPGVGPNFANPGSFHGERFTTHLVRDTFEYRITAEVADGLPATPQSDWEGRVRVR